MKKFFLLLMAFFSAMVLNAEVINGQHGTLKWSFDTETGHLEITGTGAMQESYYHVYPWCAYEKNIKTVSLSEGITHIGNYAFYDCTELLSVDIPSTVTSIGSEVFYHCVKMTSIDIPNNVQTIGTSLCERDSALVTAHIGNGISSIPFGTFASCTSMDSIHIGSSVSMIGLSRSFQCQNLRALRIDAITPPNFQGGNAYADGYAFVDVNYNKVNLYVPAESVNDYKAHGFWAFFKNHTYGMDMFTVTFKGWTAEDPNAVLQSSKVFRGDDVVAPSVPNRPGYHFIGWDQSLENISANMTINALYEEVNYTVQFFDYDGTPLGAAQQVGEGLAAVAPAEPSRIGYSFNGWDQDITAVMSDMNVKATYVATKSLTGVFSVAAGRTVQFAPGNLQYNAAKDTWRFATNQWDALGAANEKVSSTYDGWIDLLAWPEGEAENIQGTAADWAHNAIVNGGNTVGAWFTLTGAEWKYLISERPNATAKYFAATVCGHKGYVIVPDNWPYERKTPSGAELNWNTSYDLDVFTAESWAEMESAGAIFLPITGSRSGQYFIDETKGEYYGATQKGGSIDVLHFSTFMTTSYETASYSVSVRPAREVVTQFTVRFVDEDGVTELQSSLVNQGEMAAYNGAEPTKAEDADYTYEFAGWTPALAVVMGDATYKATYKATAKHLVVFKNYDGTVLQSSKWAHDSIPVYSGPTPTRPSTDQYDYEFIHWDKGIGPAVVDDEYIAQYDAIVRKYTLTVIAENGSVTAKGELNADIDITQPLPYGTLVYLTATPDEGYEFVSWSDNYDSFYGIEIKGNVTVTATFQLIDTTDLDALEMDAKATKLLIDGQIFILRGEKVYTVQGSLVK